MSDPRSCCPGRGPCVPRRLHQTTGNADHQTEHPGMMDLPLTPSLDERCSANRKKNPEDWKPTILAAASTHTNQHRSLRPMPEISLWRAPTNAAAVFLWLAFLVLAGVVVARAKKSRPRSRGFNCNLPNRPLLRRAILIWIGSAFLAGVFFALSSFMAASPWLVIHLPALQWIKLGTLFCGTILLVTVFPYRKS